MTTECNQFVLGFHPLKRREIRAQFGGGAITSDGGGLLLREVEKRTGIVRQFAACFRDYRNPDLIEHPVEALVAQRVYGLALGYEDLNDHEELRKDPLLAVLVEKCDPVGEVLAGKSTLNRLELTPATASAKARYKKIVADHRGVVRHDLLVAGLGTGRGRGQFQAVQRAFSCQHLSDGVALLHQHRQQRVLPQLLVIVEIFITEGQAVDPLRHQLLYGVFNEIRIPVVPEAGRKLTHDPDALLYFS